MRTKKKDRWGFCIKMLISTLSLFLSWQITNRRSSARWIPHILHIQSYQHPPSRAQVQTQTPKVVHPSGCNLWQTLGTRLSRRPVKRVQPSRSSLQSDQSNSNRRRRRRGSVRSKTLTTKTRLSSPSRNAKSLGRQRILHPMINSRPKSRLGLCPVRRRIRWI